MGLLKWIDGRVTRSRVRVWMTLGVDLHARSSTPATELTPAVAGLLLGRG